jgi:signal transduction histidine kinase
MKQLIRRQNDEISLAALNERDRISKELHDSIGHILSRSLIQVGALQTISGEESVKTGLEELKISLSEGMDSVRNTIHNMRDESFDLRTKVAKILSEFAF